LRLADVDMDGFIDIVLTYINSADQTSTTIVLDNIEGDSNSGVPRQFRKTSDLREMTNVAGNTAMFVTFLDIDEDGRLDYLI
jgi:hypothetical protein